MANIIAEVRQALKDNVDQKTFETGHRVFKESVKFYGVPVVVINKQISKEYFEKIKGLPKNEIFALCDELWASGYNEEHWIACNWSYYLREDYTPGDFEVFERWLENDVNNWGSCDTLCNHTIGTFVEMYPEYVSRLKDWATSANRWVRRGAAVTLIIPARKGLFLKEIFEIADILLMDEDDLVRKGYGWMLKAASEAHREGVFEYVMDNKHRMPRTALRYAIEKMPPDMRAEAMAK